MDKVREECIYERAKYWQGVLGLWNWDIVVKVIKGEDFCWYDDGQGEVKYNFVNRAAIIHLQDEDDFDNDDFIYDIEKTLVHELLHIKFSLIETIKGIDGNDLVHQLIDDLAKAYVKSGGVLGIHPRINENSGKV